METLQKIENAVEDLFFPKSDFEKKLANLRKKAHEYEVILNNMFAGWKDGDQEKARTFYMNHYQKVKGYDDYLTQLLIQLDQTVPQTDTERMQRRKEIGYIQMIQKSADYRLEKIRSVMLKDVIIPVPQGTELSPQEELIILQKEGEEAISNNDCIRAGDLGYRIYFLRAQLAPPKNKTL